MWKNQTHLLWLAQDLAAGSEIEMAFPRYKHQFPLIFVLIKEETRPLRAINGVKYGQKELALEQVGRKWRQISHIQRCNYS